MNSYFAASTLELHRCKRVRFARSGNLKFAMLMLPLYAVDIAVEQKREFLRLQLLVNENETHDVVRHNHAEWSLSLHI